MTRAARQVTGLLWGVKQSFRSYVEATGGSIEVLGGARRLDDGGFGFAPVAPAGLTVADGVVTGQGAFPGELRFDAHGGMLSVRLVDPSVEIREGEAALWAGDGRGPERLKIATLDLGTAELTETELVLPARMTLDGMMVLGDHYPPGTVIDPVRLQLSSD